MAPQTPSTLFTPPTLFTPSSVATPSSVQDYAPASSPMSWSDALHLGSPTLRYQTPPAAPPPDQTNTITQQVYKAPDGTLQPMRSRSGSVISQPVAVNMRSRSGSLLATSLFGPPPTTAAPAIAAAAPPPAVGLLGAAPADLHPATAPGGPPAVAAGKDVLHGAIASGAAKDAAGASPTPAPAVNQREQLTGALEKLPLYMAIQAAGALSAGNENQPARQALALGHELFAANAARDVKASGRVSDTTTANLMQMLGQLSNLYAKPYPMQQPFQQPSE